MSLDTTELSLAEAYRRVLTRVTARIALPVVAEVLLPPAVDAATKQDEFGFVLLEDGSVGPFYTRLGNTRECLDALLARHSLEGVEPDALVLDLSAAALDKSALALGALNAVSQHLMRLAGFDPASAGAGSAAAAPVGRIGMVGYFGPLVERYLARGLQVRVIEKCPERVPEDLGLQVSTSPRALADCDYVICTASTLINGTLDEILASVQPAASVNLMGPSASLLPDPLFQRGVAIAGGIVIDDIEALRAAVAEGRSWGSAGRKYQLTRDNYPGLAHILDQAR